MAKGATLKVTNLTDNFTFAHFQARYGESAVPLVYLTKDNEVNIITSVNNNDLPTGIELVSLLPPEAQAHAINQREEKTQEKSESSD